MNSILEINETADNGSLKTSYILSPRTKKMENARIDILRQMDPTPFWQNYLRIFLPVGYPHSVTEDYLEYQIYDSLQAFSSSIAGLLSSRAVLEGVGVGDSTASPTAALLLSILQESMGRIATILFAHRLGTSLEPECKMYRLLADIFNDTAMIIDCLSPVFPKPARVFVLSISSICRAVCGVAAGSAKASLSSHFARWGNLGELNAKDSSQETVISLLGMLVGSILVSRVSTPFATWIALILLLVVHLMTNYKAVRAVQLRSLNRQRANIVFSYLLEDGQTLTPQDVSKKERIFEKDGVLRWKGYHTLGYGQIGVEFTLLVQHLTQKMGRISSMSVDTNTLSKLIQVFQHESYILWLNVSTSESTIVLKEGSTARSQLKAWYHALVVSHDQKMGKVNLLSNAEVVAELEITLPRICKTFEDFEQKLGAAGWDLNIAALETRSLGSRIVIARTGDVRNLGAKPTKA